MADNPVSATARERERFAFGLAGLGESEALWGLWFAASGDLANAKRCGANAVAALRSALSQPRERAV